MTISNYYPIFCISCLARRKGIVMGTEVTEVIKTYYKCYLMCCTILKTYLYFYDVRIHCN